MYQLWKVCAFKSFINITNMYSQVYLYFKYIYFILYLFIQRSIDIGRERERKNEAFKWETNQ